MTAYQISGSEGYTLANLILGLSLGVLLSALLIGFDLLFRRFNLRAFNTAVLGLFVGYLMGQALVLISTAILDISAASIHISPQVLEVIKISLFLFGIYLGTLITIRSSDELSISIPFVRLTSVMQKRKDLLADSFAL